MLLTETTTDKHTEVLYKDDYTKVTYLPKKKVLICEALIDYIPIDDFKKVFQFITRAYPKLKVKKFIFDKQSLRIFHQPSMEWYFVNWKTYMYKKFDLRHHVKILPQNLPWFENTVKAGRKMIEEKYPNLHFNKLKIEYKSSLEEAIEA
ncbi:hypothetical protein KMW28_22095 [Flammeovirga yaeyamensis]|uniref:Uncharacterized protein n=1 Tax=Flammeovirga yaeyamensis TaxID=367791 RepID=A0AAX1NF79_9BACT|nr:MULTISPECIES: hypothetical protein [Flammeovirga]ANQ52853.1 hypothetical protein MY04_5522 [Flammeovirga sp. MY04]MBB3696951.1 hypothetical protein [Flammeovirga yaeyamensis]NMF33614.1 hypothetical protein [Flammeovirga yaeyamensis]QWG05118.1 hypothetical protein KMW28_22095 [Flammeovirga yaeyamensis]